MDRSACARTLHDLVERHYALLYRYAYRLSGSATNAEDLTQQAFLIAQTKLDQLRDTACAKSWLCTVLRNCYLKDGRKSAGVAFVPLEEEMLPCPPQMASAFDIDSEQLQNVLNELPEEFKSPLILFYFEEFSYKQIADQMGVPLGTIMSRLARAKAFLRQRLAPAEASPEKTAEVGSTSKSNYGRTQWIA